MNTFEKNLEMLSEILSQDNPTIDKKAERLIKEMQLQFQKGATCPLEQEQEDFVQMLLVHDVPDVFRGWAEGVRAYEIAIQRFSLKPFQQEKIKPADESLQKKSEPASQNHSPMHPSPEVSLPETKIALITESTGTGGLEEL